VSPILILLALIVGLIALLPTWRLGAAGWPRQWLASYWVVLAAAMFVILRLPGISRYLVPIVVLAYVAPFVAVPERLTRLLGGTPPVVVRRPSPPELTDGRDGGGSDDGPDAGSSGRSRR